MRYENSQCRVSIILETLLNTPCGELQRTLTQTYPSGFHEIPFDRHAIETNTSLIFFTFASRQATI